MELKCPGSIRRNVVNKLADLLPVEANADELGALESLDVGEWMSFYQVMLDMEQ